MHREIFDILRAQGRSMVWLARETGYSVNYLYQIKGGNRPASREFIRRACRALQVPESFFLPDEFTAGNDMKPTVKVADSGASDAP